MARTSHESRATPDVFLGLIQDQVPEGCHSADGMGGRIASDTVEKTRSGSKYGASWEQDGRDAGC